MSVTHIPVFVSTDPMGTSPIGFGNIEDDELVITVKHTELVQVIEKLASIDDLKCLYLGVAFKIAPNSTVIQTQEGN